MARDASTLRIPTDVTPTEVAVVAERAAAVLESGGTVVVPTDTVYGVAARPDRPEAVARLFALKDRDRSRPLAVLAADAAQASALFDLDELSPDVVAAVGEMTDAAWPGALTVVGPRNPSWRNVELGGGSSTVGVRVPDAPIVRAIAALVGPIVTTSANRSGEPTPTDASAAAASLGGDVALVIDDGPAGDVASTVVDVSVTPFRVLRRGACDPARLGLAPAWFTSPDAVVAETVP